MTRRWLSRYSLKYFKSIVYMLQASEYNLREYFAWLKRITDFRFVMKRKKLVMTSKAKLLLLSLWTMALLVAVLEILFIIQFVSTVNWLWFLVTASLIIITPILLAYLVIIPLWLGQMLIQWPKEYFIIKKAKDKVAKLRAFKIAIAGSYGKTTFKENLKVILNQSKKVAATIGNQNTPIGISCFIEKLSGKEEILIFELGEYYPGDITKLCEIVKPGIGVITGINEAHLEKFKTLKRSVNTIFELADYVKSENLYINAENDLAKSKADPQNHLYSKNGVNGWLVKDVKISVKSTKFTAFNKEKEIKVNTKLLGAHQIGPLVACIAISDKLGLSAEKIEKGISEITSFEHRMEPEYRRDGSIWIDDTYNGNPDGVKATIEFLRMIKNHRIIYVTPGLVEMGNRNEQVHNQIGKQLAGVADKVILIRNSVTSWIKKGLNDNGFKGEIIWYDDAITCYNSLPSLVKSGDIVVLQNDWPDNYV
ncbi:MAG: Mur ligase family protein [bacterium]|nr:Mur ligase family protein [bacterium]